MTVGVVTLVLVTSAGIFGYLSNAYQGATLGLDKINSQVQLMEQTKDRLYDERERITNDIEILRLERQQTIENRNEEIGSMTITDSTRYYDRLQRQKIFDRYKPELTSLDDDMKRLGNNLDNTNTQIADTEQKISDKKLELIDTGADVGPAIYIANALDSDIDTVVLFFIFILIFVFDPLAVVLVIAANMTIVDLQDKGKPSKPKQKTKKVKTSLNGDEDKKEVTQENVTEVEYNEEQENESEETVDDILENYAEKKKLRLPSPQEKGAFTP